MHCQKVIQYESDSLAKVMHVGSGPVERSPDQGAVAGLFGWQTWGKTWPEEANLAVADAGQGVWTSSWMASPGC